MRLLYGGWGAGLLDGYVIHVLPILYKLLVLIPKLPPTHKCSEKWIPKKIAHKIITVFLVTLNIITPPTLSSDIVLF